jgi:[FeFe] hydrogenase H-cluster maturation GTPase HydF
MKTPRGMRLHIALFGRRNAGKSSLLNALTNQQVSIVSDIAGTTTDPVEKPMELLPLGAVLFIDTAGIDDVGDLGEMRIEKTRRIFDRADIGLIVCPAGEWSDFEDTLVDELARREIPIVVVFSKADLQPVDPARVAEVSARKSGKTKVRVAEAVCTRPDGVISVREAMVKSVPDDFLAAPAIVGDLVPPGELVVLVVPIDKEAPKGRLIMPQVQTIRDLLDADCMCMVVKERELREALSRLNRPPALVVTDSQAFLKVAADTPPDVPLTSFSILFARYKGDLAEFVRGAQAIEELAPGDRILIAESCTHRPITEDIGRVKIPRWLRQYVGGDLQVDVHAGHDFPDNLADYNLIIHCGACVTNRRQVLSRILHAKRAGVPITNYGVTISYTLGIFDRALQPFPGLQGPS